MKTIVYQRLKSLGFSECIKNRKDNKRLGIVKSFKFEEYYCEIINRDWGFSLQMYGGWFQDGIYPNNYDVLNKKDIETIFIDIEERLNS